MAQFNIVFRVDASVNIGTGHVMRCLALAGSFKYLYNLSSTFICRNQKGNLISVIESHGNNVLCLDNINSLNEKSALYAETDSINNFLKQLSPTILIVDSYDIDDKWLNLVKEYCKKILVVDDLCNRYLSCDFLLNQTPFINKAQYYCKVPNNCKILAGATYALLNKSFAEYRLGSKIISNKAVSNILLCLGGADEYNITKLLLELINKCSYDILPINCKTTVILGKLNPWKQEIKKLLKHYNRNIELIVDADNMAKLMSEADIAIGTASVMALERSCLGIPSLTMCLAPNQSQFMENLLIHKSVIELKIKNNFIPLNYFELQLKKVIDNMQALSAVSRNICDGEGSNLVAKIIRNECIN